MGTGLIDEVDFDCLTKGVGEVRVGVVKSIVLPRTWGLGLGETVWLGIRLGVRLGLRVEVGVGGDRWFLTCLWFDNLNYFNIETVGPIIGTIDFKLNPKTTGVLIGNIFCGVKF